MRKTLLLLMLMLSFLLLFASCGTPEEPEEEESSSECTHVNTETRDAVAATCTTAGYTGNTVCKDCGETVGNGQTIAATGNHSYNSGVVTTPATCGTDGVKTFTCSVCNGTKTETIAATGEHFDYYQDALDNTHAHACVHCPLNEYEAHTPVDAGTHVDATCNEPGYTVLTCADCDGVYKVYDEGGSALGHDYGAWTVTLAATCKAEGETAHTCSRCGDTETIALSVNAKAHKYDDGTVTTEPTCCTDGVKTFMCLLCGDRSKTATVAKTLHEYDEGESDGSGWVVQTCETCPADVTPATRTYYDASTLKVATIPVETIPQDTNLELGMENATLAVPKEVVEQLGSAANVEVKADFVEPDAKATLLAKPTMTEEQRKRLQNEEIYDFGIAADGEALTGFNAAVTVTIPYTLKDGEDAEGISIWYVKDNGEIETVTAVYNETTGTVTFSVSHFSYYAVAYAETQAMKCRRGAHDLAATSKSSTASCTTYGYTVYECSYCHYEELGNFVAKKDHTWGAVQQPTVTCTEGGYTYKACTVCDTHMDLNYVRANGHTASGAPTCESGVVCTVCNALVKPALGHSFGEWAVTVEPTVTTEGEKARVCATCGKKEAVRLAPEGTVEAYEFNTIDDYYIFFFREFTGLEKGRFTMAFDMSGTSTTVDVSFDTTNDKLVFVAKTVTTMQVSPEKTESTYNDVYYDGARVFIYNDGDVMVEDLEGLMSTEGITMEFIYGLLEEAFEMVNPIVEPYFDLATDVLAVLPASSAEKLATYVDAIRTVYAYYALRLGFDTNIEMVEGVKIPTPKDYKIFVEALMVEDSANPGTYTFSAETIYNLIDDVCAYLDDNKDVAVGTLVYDILAEDIKAVYPEVTGYESFLDRIATEFPGTMTVKEAVLKLVQMALTTDMTLADIYEAIDVVLNMNAAEGQEVSSAEMLAAYADMTLNDVLTMMMSDPEAEEPMAVTVEDLITMAKQMAAITLGEIQIPVPMENDTMVFTAEMISTMLKGVKEEFALTLDATLVLDGEGNLVSVNVGLGVAMNPPAEAPEGTEPMEMLSGSLTFSNVPDLTPPATLDEYVGIDVKATFDEAGNLIISGVDSDIAFVFDIFGDHTYTLSSVLVKDEALSAELGYDVYKLDARYSTDSYWDMGFVKINGKYYHYEYVSEYLVPTKEEGRVSLDGFLKNPTAYLPAADAEHVGYIGSIYMNEDYKDGDLELDEMTKVYVTYAGFVYKEDGVWYLIDVNSSYCEMRYFWDEEIDDSIYYAVFDEEELVAVPYADAFSNARLANYGAYENNGGMGYIERDIEDLFREVYGSEFVYEYDLVGIETDGFSGLVYMLADVSGNGIDIVLGENRIGERDWYYEVTGTVDVDNLEGYFAEYYGKAGSDLSDVYITTDHSWVSGNTYVLNGVAYTGTLEYLRAELHLAEYFREVEDGVYVSLGMSGKGDTKIGFADVSQYETMNVGGKTLYVKGNANGYTFGYVELANGEYIQACVDEAGNLIYRGQESEIRIDLYDIYDVEDFVTKDALGNYKISAELFKSLGQLLSEDEAYYILMMNEDSDLGDDHMLRIELPVYSTVKAPDVSVQDAVNNMMMGGGSAETEAHLDWSYWFNDYGFVSGVSVIPNADGTVSIFAASGDQITLSYTGKNFSVAPYVVKDESLSRDNGYDVYTANKTEKNVTPDYVKIGNDYYRFDTRWEYNVSYFSSASQITLSDYEIRELTLVIPKSSGSAYDIYLGKVYFKALSKTMDFYFVYEAGVLKVLTGVEREGSSVDAIQYEGAVTASTYFSALKLNIRTENAYTYDNITVGGKSITIWRVYADVIEPSSLGGFDEDTNVLDHEVGLLATKNGSRFTYVKDYTSHGKAKIVIGEKVTIPSEYKLNYSYKNEYENGTFEIVDFKYTETTKHSYVKLCGEFYEMNYRWWDAIYSKREMQESLYDTVYIWLKAGTSELYIKEGDDLVSYDNRYGTLDFANAYVYEVIDQGDVVYYQYVFYISTDMIPVYTMEIGGQTVYYNEGWKGFIEVSEDVYVPCWVNAEEQTISSIPYLDFGYADSLMIESSSIMKEYVTTTHNGRVIVLREGIMDLLGENFEIKVLASDKDSTVGYISYDRLREAFDIAEGLANGN